MESPNTFNYDDLMDIEHINDAFYIDLINMDYLDYLDCLDDPDYDISYYDLMDISYS